MKNQSQHRRAFTLLEVILALGLAVIVLALVGMAINTTLRTLDRGQANTQRDQLARAVLQRIGADLRAVVRYEPFDDAGLAAAGAGAAAEAAGALGGESAGGTETEPGSTTESTSEQPETLAADATPAAIAGLYGNQYELQIDVGRIPRVDEYTATAEGQAPASDVRTVAYYFATGSEETNPFPFQGLVRREVNRAAAQYTAAQGDASSLNMFATVLADEVQALEFRYFDGTQWLTEWDSTAASGLPQAVEVAVVLAGESFSPNAAGAGSIFAPSADNSLTTDPDSVYRLVVSLPAADPVTANAMPAEETGDMGSSSESTSGSGSGSGSGGGAEGGSGGGAKGGSGGGSKGGSGGGAKGGK